MQQNHPTDLPRLENSQGFLFCVCGLTVLIFILLGKETSAQLVPVRLILSGILFLWALIKAPWVINKRIKKLPISTILFFVFFVFQIGRAVYAFYGLKFSGVMEGSQLAKWRLYWVAPMQWGSYFAVFIVFYEAILKKRQAVIIIRVFCWTAFLLALNALPPLLQLKKEPIYSFMGMHRGFFLPFFYQFKWFENYLFSRFAHVNVLGDVLSFGMFPALGVALYSLHLRTLGQHETLDTSEEHSKTLPFAFMRLMMAAVIFATTLLLFSRGSIISVVMGLFFFTMGFAWKALKKKKLFLPLLAFFGLIFVMAVWAGNLSKAFNEAFTVTQETGKAGTSSYANRQGKTIAMAMYHGNKILGVGLNGYGQFSTRYDARWLPGLKKKDFYHSSAFSHYLTILCEEGLAGGILYFSFLAAWFCEMVWGLLMTKSYFKFLMGLSFASSVVTVLIHSSFGYLMQFYGTSALVYASMGISLGLINKSFQHAD